MPQFGIYTCELFLKLLRCILTKRLVFGVVAIDDSFSFLAYHACRLTTVIHHARVWNCNGSLLKIHLGAPQVIAAAAAV